MFRNVVLVIIVVVLMFGAGCGAKSTDGRNHKILPIEFSFALVSGESEQKVGVGKNAASEAIGTSPDFNDARARISEARGNRAARD